MTSPGPSKSPSVWTVFRRLQLPLHMSNFFPLRTFAKEADAQADAIERTQAYMGLMDARLMKTSSGGYVDCGMTVKELLSDLGIANIGHNVGEIEVVDGPKIVVPQSGIIMPPGNKH